jgi:hypothetical protein
MKELKCNGDSNGSFRALAKACVKGVRLKRGHSIPRRASGKQRPAMCSMRFGARRRCLRRRRPNEESLARSRYMLGRFLSASALSLAMATSSRLASKLLSQLCRYACGLSDSVRSAQSSEMMQGWIMSGAILDLVSISPAVELVTIHVRFHPN